MFLQKIFDEKGIDYKLYKNGGADLRNRFQDIFAPNLNETDKNYINIDDFLWHAFSYGKLECIEGEAANEYFKEAKKDKIYIFYQFRDFYLEVNNADKLAIEKIINNRFYENERFELLDLYIVDESFKWTYAYTHENVCGPYFHERILN